MLKREELNKSLNESLNKINLRNLKNDISDYNTSDNSAVP